MNILFLLLIIKDLPLPEPEDVIIEGIRF